VKREPGGQPVSLPEYLQIEFLLNKNGRDFFNAVEGIEQGKSFSVLQGNLRKGLPAYRPAARLEFNITTGKLSFPGGILDAITGKGSEAIPLGSHPIQIPDFPHDIGSTYLGKSQYALSWLYLGRGPAIKGNNDRYLHAGMLTAGCVTVDPGAWTKLYQYLILCRSGDGKTVGSIVVRR
jgi:hypothetical protein